MNRKGENKLTANGSKGQRGLKNEIYTFDHLKCIYLIFLNYFS